MLHVNASPSSVPTPPLVPRYIRALLLDDSNFDRARIRRLSDKTDLCVHMDEVDSIAAMNQAVARENYDLILIDYRLPVGDGIVALDELLQHDASRDAAKIMITGDNGRRTAVEAMRHGCHDFLTKEELDAEALRQAMLNALATAQQRQQAMFDRQQQHLLIRDGLFAALQDEAVQDNVVALVRQNMDQDRRAGDELRNRFGAGDVDSLLASFGEDDEFIFH